METDMCVEEEGSVGGDDDDDDETLDDKHKVDMSCHFGCGITSSTKQ